MIDQHLSSVKEQKEAFVSGHTGTTPLELLLVCVSAPIGLFLFNELKQFVHVYNFRGILVFIESIAILLPMAICQTEFLYPFGVTILICELFAASILHLLRSCNVSKNFFHNVSEEMPKETPSSKLRYLTYYRSTVSYLTFVAILAVDFTIFPRSFAKTETYGYGLMDLGAGSFIVSAGLVSWYAKFKPVEPQSLIKNTLLRCVPLTIMGFLRLLTTKGLDYQEHVSEYGVHWNFFFTLCVVSISSTVIRLLSIWLGFKLPTIQGIILLVLYQCFLLWGSASTWQDYIENAPRKCETAYEKGREDQLVCDFFAANREGILGSIGYLIMYLVSEDLGRFCLTRQQQNGKNRQGGKLFLVTIVFWLLHWVSVSLLGIAVSRRSTNSSFILWTIAHNMTILLLTWLAFWISETKLEFNSQSSPIFEAVNRHGLIVFILANLMTGVINLSMNTLEATRNEALLVLFCYLVVVGAVALLVDNAIYRVLKENFTSLESKRI